MTRLLHDIAAGAYTDYLVAGLGAALVLGLFWIAGVLQP